MIAHVWSVLCRKVSIDRETNNVSLFDVLEQIQVYEWAGPAGIAGPFELASLWYRPDVPSRGEARVTLRSPSGRLLHEATQEIDLREFRRVRVRYLIPGMHIEGSGTYSFIVEGRQQNAEDWFAAASIPLEVNVTTLPMQRAVQRGS